MGGTQREDEMLRVSIEYPHFKLNLTTADAKTHLGDIRRIVEVLGSDETIESVEEASLFELKSRLSEEFFQHPDLIGRVKNSLVLDEDIRIVKQVIAFESEYNLETGKETKQVSVLNVKKVIATLFETIDTQKVRECLVHIRGEFSRDQQCVIMDAIKQHVGISVQSRFFSTKKNLEGNALVEVVCFGEGISAETEW